MSRKVAIIGGGISGIVTAIKFAQDKHTSVHVFEKRNCILRGPPYCHLHAGGVLYPEINIDDAQQLLNDSILFANKFKNCLDYRPTIVAYKAESKYSPSKLLFKCKVNKLSYLNNMSRPFGKVDNFYSSYSKQDILYYKQYGKLPESDDIGRKYHDAYVEHFCKLLNDIESIKYPFVSICEPGINQKKVENLLEEELETLKNIEIFLNTDIKSCELDNYDIIINATGKNIFKYYKDEMYEFKSSWIIRTPLLLNNFPEIAIIGERGTDNGMIQLTPLYEGKFQIHCMRSDSTIISTYKNEYPSVIELNEEDIDKRTKVAISQISKYFPIFAMSYPDSACSGIQRIINNNKLQRTSNITVIKTSNKTYIDIFTLKAGSIISLMNKI
jgi:hypothetical protein